MTRYAIGFIVGLAAAALTIAFLRGLSQAAIPIPYDETDEVGA